MLLFCNALHSTIFPHLASLSSGATALSYLRASPVACAPVAENKNVPSVSSARLARTRLILAPMEVLADKQFRAAIGVVGGMDEAVHEFIRITSSRHHPAICGSFRNRYNAREMGDIPLAAQIMGGDPSAMALATSELATRYGAHRIDLNCGCPSKRVTGHGAGASLLKKPEGMFEVVKAMVDAVEGIEGCEVSVKMRSGFDSTDLFNENVRAVVEAGATMITLHPRTKVQAYSGDANWDFIRRAKELCGDGVEIVGNGDVTCAADAVRMLEYTGCDHVMVGRGAVKNPWIFWEIREALAQYVGTEGFGTGGQIDKLRERTERNFTMEKEFYTRYLNSAGGIHDNSSAKAHKAKIGRFKMLLGFSTTISEEDKSALFRSNGAGDARRYLEELLRVIRQHYEE